MKTSTERPRADKINISKPEPLITSANMASNMQFMLKGFDSKLIVSDRNDATF